MRLFLMAGLFAGLATAASISYGDFSSTAGLTLNGDAAQAANVLRVVPSVAGQAGTAYYTAPVSLDGSTSFSTSFEFLVQPDYGSGFGVPDGFTFLLQNAGVNALGDGGDGLGYAGINPSVAIVFRGRGPSFIGVITGGTNPNALPVPFEPAAGYTSLTEGVFYGQDEFAWIDYSSGALNVYLSSTSGKPVTPIMSASVDVAGTLGSQAYVGFSAGNGAAYGSQDILNWSFDSSEVPEPSTAGIFAFGLAALGLLRRACKR
jgi:hypothetical protein